MAKVDLIMPKMGESIMEATILKWLKQVGEKVEVDESILEIATDKVDSDIPSPVAGVIVEILFKEDDVVEVGKVIARISTSADEVIKPSPATPEAPSSEPAQASLSVEKTLSNGHQVSEKNLEKEFKTAAAVVSNKTEYRPSQTSRFYSPLVRTIAERESISISELDSVPGSGAKGRVTKKDILGYIKQRSGEFERMPSSAASSPQEHVNIEPAQKKIKAQPEVFAATVSPAKSAQNSMSGTSEIIEMDRMRKLIADHMVMSKQTSPHVTSFVEVDVTNVVQWRENIKDDFVNKYGEKITYTPIFMEAVNKAIKDFPMVNVSLDGDKIIKKNFINLGMAAALPSGNLIVPVIKNADHLNLLGLTKAVNDLADRARNNKLKADEIQGGTFTITNVGTFGNVMGTPIINQPQVAILAVGAIKKKPAVVETEMGDLIAIRHMMFLSLSYDHRVVDGFLGGSFLRKIADYLEAFDKNRNI